MMSRLFPQVLIDTIKAGASANDEAVKTVAAHAMNDWIESRALEARHGCCWRQPILLATIALDGDETLRSTTSPCKVAGQRSDRLYLRTASR